MERRAELGDGRPAATAAEAARQGASARAALLAAPLPAQTRYAREDSRQPLSPTALPPPANHDPAALPSWIPELAANVHADVYPVLDELRISEHALLGLKLSPELELDRSGVSSGYAERRQPWEFSSCLPPPPPAGVAAEAPAASGVPTHAASPGTSAIPSSSSSALASGIASSPNPSPKIAPNPAHEHASPPLPIMTPTENSCTAQAATNAAPNATGLSVVTADKLHKIAIAMSALRKAPPVLPQRQVLADEPPEDDTGSVQRRRPFPLQKPPATLDLFLAKLASGKHSTSSLCTAVPMAPAVVRSAGKVLEALAKHRVPAQRATWFIRIALLNECHKQARPDRAAPSPRILWTKSLSDYMKSDCDSVRSRRLPSVHAVHTKSLFWDYVLDLARWQADEGLLDTATWLQRLLHELRRELASAQSILRDSSHGSPEDLEVSLLGCRIVLGAVERFEPEILQSRDSTKALNDALIQLLLPLVTSGRGMSNNSRVHPGPPSKNHAVATTIRARVVARLGALLHKGVKRYFSGDGPAPRPPGLQPRGVPASWDPSSFPEKISLEDLVDKSAIMLGVSRKRGVTGDSPAPNCSPMSASSFGSVLTAVPILPSMPGELVSAFALQKFPLDGDPGYLKDILLFELGSAAAAVRFVCRWAVEGTSPDGVLTPITAATAVRALESSVERGTGQGRPAVPLFFREILSFMTQSDENSASTVAVLVAHLCMMGEFSMQAYMREISRLTAENPKHLKYLQLLPEPADRAAASARRSILRRKGLMQQCDETFDDSEIEYALSKADLRTVAKAGSIVKARSLTTCLTAIDTVSHMDEKSVTGRLGGILVFLEAAGGLLSAVQLTIRQLSSLSRVPNWNDNQIADICAGLTSLLRMSSVVAAAGTLMEVMILVNDFRKHGSLPEPVSLAMEKCASGFTERFSGSCHGWQTWVKTLGVLVRDYRGSRDPQTPAHLDAPSSDVIGLRDRLMAGHDPSEQDRNSVVYEPNEAIMGALIPGLRANFGQGEALRILQEFPLCFSLYGVRPTTAVDLISFLASDVKSTENEEGKVWPLLRELLHANWIREACLGNPAVVSAAKLGDDVDMSAAIMCELLRGHPGAPWMPEDRTATIEVAEILNLTDAFNASIAEMHVTVLVAQRREKENIDDLCLSLSKDAVNAAKHLASKESVAAIIGRIIPSVCHDPSDSSVKALSAGHLVQSATAAMADSFTDLIRAAFDKELDFMQELVKTEASLRDLVKASLPIARLTDRDAVGQGVFEQLQKASGLLGRGGAEKLLSTCDTTPISVALTERLECLLFTVVSGESAGSGASVLVDLVINSAPLLDRGGIEALLTALKVIIGPRKMSNSVLGSQPGGAEAKELLRKVREADVNCWLTRKSIARLEATLGGPAETPSSARPGVEVYRKEPGVEKPQAVDPWLLLEGYGSRPDEEPAINLESFGCQGNDRNAEHIAPVVRLKRTYSTFACLVR